MSYYLYKKNGSKIENVTDDFFEIRSFVPHPFKIFLAQEKKNLKTALARLNFWCLTYGKAKIYYVLSENDKIMHTSYLIPTCRKFAFMKKDEFQIGPCFTDKQFRGKGIYPAVLRHITSQNEYEGKMFYMLVFTENLPSIKGIEKAGFKRCGNAKKTNAKRYVLLHGDENE